jgi:hypothetical protein
LWGIRSVSLIGGEYGMAHRGAEDAGGIFLWGIRRVSLIGGEYGMAHRGAEDAGGIFLWVDECVY